MKSITILLLLTVFIPKELNAQKVITDLGGPSHIGFYKTQPVKTLDTVLWKTMLDGWTQQNCITKGNVLYVSANKYNGAKKTFTGFIYAVNVLDGSVIWKDSVDQNISSPTMKDSILYYGSDSRVAKQFAFNGNTGKMIWSININGTSCYPPAIIGNSIFFGTHGNRWDEVDNRTGELINEAVCDTDICCSASVKDDMVFYVEWGKLHAYNSKTKVDKWVFKYMGKAFSAPAIVDNVAYFVSEEGTIYAIDANTGQLIWKYKTDDSMYRSPSVDSVNGIVTVITTNGHIYAFNIRDGTVIWDIVKKGKNNWPIYTHTAIADNIVYVGCADGFIYALELKTGKEIWKYETGMPVGTPLVDNGKVFFTSGPNVYCIK
jgi:outer membrane protein assembly factor BamB